MRGADTDVTNLEANRPEDAEAIRHLRDEIAGGKNWYIALLESIGLWASTQETYRGREYCYLISGEAFDWLLLAERLCQTVEKLLPEAEKNDLVFQGKPPMVLTSDEVKALVGPGKYCHYLNYFYGITVEGMLLLAVQGEVHKERQTIARSREMDIIEEAYRRIYDRSRAELLDLFREQCGVGRNRAMTLTELKEFTYWLFKYRVNNSEKARVASDTKKALAYLKRQWAKKGIFGALAADDPCRIRT